MCGVSSAGRAWLAHPSQKDTHESLGIFPHRCTWKSAAQVNPDEESRQRLRALRGEAPLPAAEAPPPPRLPVRTAQDDLADAEAAAAVQPPEQPGGDARPAGGAADGSGAAPSAAAAAEGAGEDSEDDLEGAACMRPPVPPALPLRPCCVTAHLGCLGSFSV
jgi:hypothetical protein